MASDKMTALQIMRTVSRGQKEKVKLMQKLPQFW